MNLEYFKALKASKKAGLGSYVPRLLKAKPYVIPPRLLDGIVIDTNEKLMTICSIPFSDTFFEFSETLVFNGEEVRYIHCIEKSPVCFYIAASLKNKDVVFTINKDEEKIITATIGEEREAALVTAVLFRVIHAITRKEFHLGRAKFSKLIRGRVHPFEITYIRRKNQIYEKTDKDVSEIDWKHSWRVSGHWSKISGVGKDREGKRCVKGYTWVVPHIKGKGPLVEKIRVLTS